MKCLTVRQPLALAIVLGVKAIEFRSRPTSHRGPLLIHASQSRAYLHDTEALALLPGVDEGAFVLGAVVGQVELADCLPGADAAGLTRWLLRSQVAFPRPVPCSGQLGTWNLPAGLEGKVSRARPRQRTTVVNVRHAPPGSFLYVGRAVRGRFAGSPWGNPFREGTKGEVLAAYRAHVLSRPDLVACLPELRGRALGCWCCDSTERPADPADYACHAQVLGELADGPLGNAPAGPDLRAAG